MNPAKRIVINTVAQYSRSIITIILSLYSTRLILAALGVSDFGIYSIIGGVVAMLGFITNALVVTTQRYVSFHYGQEDMDAVRKVFSNSLLIHAVFAIILSLILFLLKDVVIYHWIKIPLDRIAAAENVYLFTIAILAITILIAPYKAVFIARENIVYISIVEVLDGFLKLFLAVYITYSTFDRLVLYAAMMVFIQLCNLLAFSLYAIKKFGECSLGGRRKDISSSCILNLLGFAGWTTYGAGVVVFRNQGIAIMLNNFFGTVINAAYGIAFQVQGAMAFVSTSVLNAMNPQIMKAEGAGDRDGMLKLAMQESKYSSALMMIIAIPAIWEIHSILSFWLKEVPPGAEMFCTFILLSFIADQLTYGLNTANQASGKVRIYSLLMYTPKLAILPLALFVLFMWHEAVYVMCVYLIIELIVSVSRLFYMRRTMGLNVSEFVTSTICPLLPLCLVLFVVGYLCVKFVEFPHRFIFTMAVSVLLGVIVFWHFTMSNGERLFAKNFFVKKH